MKSITNWEYSIESEANRLVQCAYQIAVGFYKTNNFIVLPYNPNIKTANVVTFPDLSFTKIPRFWEQAKKAEVKNLPVIIDKNLLATTISFLEKEVIKKPSYEKIKLLWKKSEKNIINEIYKVLPSKKNLIKKITIYPTLFGTSCSFNWIDKNGNIIIYLRDDQGIHTITEAVVTSLTRTDIYGKLEGLWQESEIITDYLVTETSIAKVLQKCEDPKLYIPTLKGVRIKEQAKLLAESDEFYVKLGIPSFTKPFGYNGLIPELFGKPVANLTETERKVLLSLIRKSNTVTEIDDIGSVMFKSEDNFSLYAISKTIQRLRDKLEANGISGSYIQTLRGKGYVLKN
ncbi:MAG: helix-turn-helix domain-containing protein [Patescibacteria group bacterium]